MSSLTTIEKEFGIFLKKSRDGKLRKYKISGKRHGKICMKQDCLTGIMPKEDYCIRFINSGRCDNNIIDTNIELTEREKEAGITLRKNRKGEIKNIKNLVLFGIKYVKKKIVLCIERIMKYTVLSF